MTLFATQFYSHYLAFSFRFRCHHCLYAFVAAGAFDHVVIVVVFVVAVVCFRCKCLLSRHQMIYSTRFSNC